MNALLFVIQAAPAFAVSALTSVLAAVPAALVSALTTVAEVASTAPDIEFVHLGIRIGKLFRGFSLFGGKFYIAMYGVCIALGVICGAMVAFAGGKRNRENGDNYTDFAFIAIILSLVGARVYYVIFQWDYYKTDLKQIFHFRAGGLAIYGGVITAIVSAIVFSKIKKMNFFRMADNAVPGLILGQAIGRWGNFFNCECFGGYTDNLFAMRIKQAALNRTDMITEELQQAMLEHPVKIDNYSYIQVHPTFLYEFLWNIASFVIMMVFHYSKWKKNDGEVLALYCFLYGCGRFWIESLRTDQLLIPKTSIPVSMVVSAILVVVGIGLFVWSRFFAKNTLNALNAVLVRDHIFFIGGAPKVDPAYAGEFVIERNGDAGEGEKADEAGEAGEAGGAGSVGKAEKTGEAGEAGGAGSVGKAGEADEAGETPETISELVQEETAKSVAEKLKAMEEGTGSTETPSWRKKRR